MDTDTRTRIVIVTAIVAVVAATVAILLTTGDDEPSDAPGSTTSAAPTTEDRSTTTSSSTSSSSPTTAPPTVTDAEAATIVWPAPGTEPGYDDPTEAVTDFAVGPAGFATPVIGSFAQGDSRSGEVEVRPVADGPVTTVLVRRMSDDHWYVIAAVSSEIELSEPTAGSAIDHPLQVSGRARTVDGELHVAVYERGVVAPAGEGSVAVGIGAGLEPFSGEVAWANPGGGWGSVIVIGKGGDDDRTWSAVAIPVGFIGGD